MKRRGFSSACFVKVEGSLKSHRRHFYKKENQKSLSQLVFLRNKEVNRASVPPIEPNCK